MKRPIIKIDEEKCDGCGACIVNCPEGALKIIDGKARLVKEILCDGLGACIGHCPQDAIIIEKRESEDYDEIKVVENVLKEGKEVLEAHLKHLKDHGQNEYLKQAQEYLKENNIPFSVEASTPEPVPCGCPGAVMKDLRAPAEETVEDAPSGEGLSSELRQWPIQLHLVNPIAPYFKDSDLLVSADCVPFSYPGFHSHFLKGKTLVIFCPKLDGAKDLYAEKLVEIFKLNNIKSVTALHMEVPCCFGTVSLVKEALEVSGKDIEFKELTISMQGKIK